MRFVYQDKEFGGGELLVNGKAGVGFRVNRSDYVFLDVDSQEELANLLLANVREQRSLATHSES